jgi:hypothetical protein
VTPLANKAYSIRTRHIQQSKTIPGIKCHYNYLTSEVPLLILHGYNQRYQKVKQIPDKQEQDKSNPFNSKYLAFECMGPTTNEVQHATDKERERKVTINIFKG